MYSLDSVPVFHQFKITIIMCSRLFRPLSSHDLVVRHTISAFILQLLVNLTISHDLAEIIILVGPLNMDGA